MRRRFLIELALMALLLPPAMVWLGQAPGLAELDLAVYDRVVNAEPSPPSTEILIIGIDERSLREIGPWPWPRSVHARLLDRLAAARPRAVLLDVFLDEVGAWPDDNPLLADAMERLPTYLPLRYDGPGQAGRPSAPGFRAPLQAFLAQARGVGHVNVTVDADGVARRMFLREGVGDVLQPHLGWLVAAGADSREPDAPVETRADGWQTQAAFGIVLAGPAGTYRTVPYLSVLRGEVPDELLRDKILLVGAVESSELGDELPVAGLGPQKHLSGVELQANAIDALRGHRAIRFMGFAGIMLWTTLPIWAALGLFTRAAGSALAIALAAALGCVALSFAGLVWGHLWLPPAAPVLGIAAAYLLWSWRRLAALLAFFKRRVEALNRVPAGAFEPAIRTATPAIRTATPAIDEVERQTQALDRAIDRLSQMQALLSEGMWQLPVAVLVCQTDGRIGQSNAAARMLLMPDHIDPDMTHDPLRNRSLPRLLLSMNPVGGRADGDAPFGSEPHWSQVVAGEYETPQGNVFRLRVAALGGSEAPAHNWVAVLRDLTAERLIQRKREQWLSFLTHDLRSPQVSILSLLELRAQPGSGVDESRLIEGVRRDAQRTLALAESFMDMAEAESDDYRFVEALAGTLVLDAIDRAWPYAKVLGVTLVPSLSERYWCVRADTVLLTRALLNLLNNAIRHSARGGSVRICLEGSPDRPEVVLAVTDDGDGMNPGQLSRALGRSRSGMSPEARDDDAMHPARSRGLGLAVVRAVVARHGGWLEVHSAPGAGASFLIGLPVSEWPAEAKALP